MAARVKTALVNDAALGVRVIEVRVADRVVTLSGRVGSTQEVEHAIGVARAVPGVAEVKSQLAVSDLSKTPPPPAPALQPVVAVERERSAGQRRLLAVGAAMGRREPTSDRLSSRVSFGPLVRLGSGRGFGPTIGFSWFTADLGSESAPQPLGRLSIRPIMGGVGYTFTHRVRWSLTASLAGGVAFNSFSFDDLGPGGLVALEVGNSLALRPGASLWFDVNSRFAVNVFTGYVFTRPRVTFLDSGQLVKREVRADATIVNLGVAYKLF